MGIKVPFFRAEILSVTRNYEMYFYTSNSKSEFFRELSHNLANLFHLEPSMC